MNVIAFPARSDAESILRDSVFLEGNEDRLPEAIRAFDEKLNSPGGCALSAYMKAVSVLRGYRYDRNY